MLDGIASKRPDFAEMSPDLAKATVDQKVGLEKLADELGPAKSISFRQKDGENDLYAVEMEKGALLVTIGPTKDGKLSTLFFQPVIKREGSGECGSSCNVQCAGSATCQLRVGSGASVDCSDDSRCDIVCDGGCSVSCGSDAQCRLTCGGGVSMTIISSAVCT
jgi:hypothetical protein